MRLLILCIGRLKAGPERTLYEHYARRVDQTGRSVGLCPLSTVELRESQTRAALERRSEEAALLIAKLPEQSVVWTLDQRGDHLTSARFADALAALRDGGAATLSLLIGGADGHGEAVRSRSDRTVALSTLTLPHGLARVVLAEQLYRATTILAGHPYHRV